ncbi:Tyrosine-Protein Kinase Baz1B [Manis pentadactyla]|nr:Tyrosine-Protein Kinase Baz1B [Manis pentadactyla]
MSFLGPLREPRVAGLQNPQLPLGAKFQVVGLRKERAPLFQGEASGIESKSRSGSRPGAAPFPQRPALCWWRDCRTKGSRGIGRSESPALERLPWSAAGVPPRARRPLRLCSCLGRGRCCGVPARNKG